MTTRQHPRDRLGRRLPDRQVALSDRISLAPAADTVWLPARSAWSHWRDEVDDETLRAYRMLRRSCEGKERFSTINDLKRAVQVSYTSLNAILDDLDSLGFISVRREHGTITAITVNEPPLLLEDVEQTKRHLVRNRPAPPRSDDVQHFVRYWCSRYEQHRGHAYHVRRGKDTTLVRDLLATYGLDELKRLAWYLLHSGVGEDVIRYDEVSIGSFAARINRIVMEKRRDEMPSARIR